jgi:hypothetical protein
VAGKSPDTAFGRKKARRLGEIPAPPCLELSCRAQGPAIEAERAMIRGFFWFGVVTLVGWAAFSAYAALGL